jgi:hypothetical protein
MEECYKSNNSPPSESDLWLTRLDLPDYTPRLRGKDTDDLEDAVDDALRMTPSVFYAGEIRKPDDWMHLSRLAQSHLVVATTHASSLINTFGNLARHLRVRTPTQRNELAASMRAVVHMRGTPPLTATTGGACSAVLPACWVGTPGAVAAFTSDGLASINPKFVNLASNQERVEAFCLGRRSFAYAFLGYAKRPPEPPSKSWIKGGGFESAMTQCKAEERKEALDRFLECDAVAAAPSAPTPPDASAAVASPATRPADPTAKPARPVLPEEGAVLKQLAAAWDLRGE